MKKCVEFAFAAALCVGTAFAQQQPQSPRPKMTPQEHKAMMERKFARHGGMIELAPSGNVIRVVSAQKKVSEEDLRQSIDVFKEALRVPVEWVSDASGVQDPAKLARAANKDGKCGVAVVLVDDPEAARLLVAPENGWAAVNLAKLDEDAPGHEKLVRRTRQEYWRAACMVLGAYVAPVQPCLLTMIANNAGLDNNPCVIPAVEALPKAKAAAKTLGIKAGRRVLYDRACKEGWAPAPTNEFQKAIWDKVHAMPSAPLTIKPEAKKVVE